MGRVKVTCSKLDGFMCWTWLVHLRNPYFVMAWGFLIQSRNQWMFTDLNCKSFVSFWMGNDRYIDLWPLDAGICHTHLRKYCQRIKDYQSSKESNRVLPSLFTSIANLVLTCSLVRWRAIPPNFLQRKTALFQAAGITTCWYPTSDL